MKQEKLVTNITNQSDLNFQSGLMIASAIVIFLGIFHMPYGYYDFLRVTGTAAFGFIVYFNSAINRNNIIAGVSIAFVLMFNPLFKIGFTRELWLYIDTIAAVFLILYSFIHNRSWRL